MSLVSTDPAQKPKRKPPAAGMGRKKGSKNKVSRDLKEMIWGALDQMGGQAYLVEQARKKPEAFLVLLGKTMPRLQENTGETTVKIVVVTGIPLKDGNL